MQHHRAQAQFSRDALVHNFKLLGAKVPALKLIPMVKANAYGHGSLWAAHTLLNQKQIYGFGVATFQEAIQLRKVVPERIPVLVFSDCAPWSEELHRLVLRHNLSPVFSEFQSFKKFISLCGKRPKPTFHLEFNTGMNRLGLDPRNLYELALLLISSDAQPESVFTHLAESESPDSVLTRKQIKIFSELGMWVKNAFPKTHLHFANSAAIWNAKKYPLMKDMALARPGLSLYGVRPFEEAKENASNGIFKRVMSFSAPILNLITLKKGDKVGYGGTYQCLRAQGETVAVVGAGYADGVFRSLSNRGFVVHQGKKSSILGRVSMDLTAIAAHSQLKVGNRVEFWGKT